MCIRDSGCTKGDMEQLLLLLSPFAPHIVEEIWERLGFAAKYGKMCCQCAWPKMCIRDSYFAILKVRPTPFCVMDEIEAALDEANVTRYVQYMRRLAKSTQFLVITHRRGTMEEADHLFGVTMQEKGVSRIIELSLDEAAKTIS